MLGKVVVRYLEGMDEPLINSIQVILRATMGGMNVASAEGIATPQSLCQEVGCPYHDELFFFFNRWLQRISRILAVLGYKGIKQATPMVLKKVKCPFTMT